MFSDLDVRKGFSYAFDYDTYIRDVYMNEADRCITPVVDTLPYHNPAQAGYDLNLALAEDHLRTAWGGDLWANGFSLTLAYNTGNVPSMLASEMLRNAIESLNPLFHIDIAEVPWPQYLNELVSFKLTAFVLGWLADYPDPHNFVYPFMHTEGTFAYFQRYSNPIVDALIEEGIATPDGPARQAIYYELQEIYVDDNPSVPLAKPVERHWELDWVMGWYYNPIYPGHYFKHLWKGYMADVDKDYDVDTEDLFLVLLGYGMTIEDAMATYGVPPGTDIDGDGWIGAQDLFWVLGWLQMEAEIEKTLTPTSGELGDVVHVNIELTTVVPSGFIMNVADKLPTEFGYIEGSFTLDEVSVTPTINENVVSYILTEAGTYVIEFDVNVTKAYGVDTLVTNTATAEWYYGGEFIADVEATADFTILWTPESAIQDAVTTIESWNLKPGTEKSLTLKLKDALHLLNKDNVNGAVHKIGDFIKHVEAMREKKLTNEQADYLIEEAQKVIDRIME